MCNTLKSFEGYILRVFPYPILVFTSCHDLLNYKENVRILLLIFMFYVP